MVGIGDGALVPRDIEPVRAAPASHPVNWGLAFLMVTVLIAGVTGVVLALSSGMPNVAIVIALVTGAVFAGQAC
jgi:hypothetical protein